MSNPLCCDVIYSCPKCDSESVEAGLPCYVMANAPDDQMNIDVDLQADVRDFFCSECDEHIEPKIRPATQST